MSKFIKEETRCELADDSGDQKVFKKDFLLIRFYVRIVRWRRMCWINFCFNATSESIGVRNVSEKKSVAGKFLVDEISWFRSESSVASLHSPLIQLVVSVMKRFSEINFKAYGERMEKKFWHRVEDQINVLRRNFNWVLSSCLSLILVSFGRLGRDPWSVELNHVANKS